LRNPLLFAQPKVAFSVTQNPYIYELTETGALPNLRGLNYSLLNSVYLMAEGY
jgi:hypothetical protein